MGRSAKIRHRRRRRLLIKIFAMGVRINKLVAAMTPAERARMTVGTPEWRAECERELALDPTRFD